MPAVGHSFAPAVGAAMLAAVAAMKARRPSAVISTSLVYWSSAAAKPRCAITSLIEHPNASPLSKLCKLFPILQGQLASVTLFALGAFAYDTPNAMWRRRHVDMADTMRQSIHDCISDRCRRADCSNLAAALHAHRRVPPPRTVRLDRHSRQIVCSRHAIIHERARQELAGCRIVNAVLAQRLTYPLNDSAVQLALDNHGIDDSADVVNGRVVDELHDAGIGVDLYFGDIN